MTRNANAAPGRAAQAADVRAQVHSQSTRFRFPRHSTQHICPTCGASATLIGFGRFGDSPARCSACGYRAQRCEFRRAGRPAWAGGAP